VPAIDTVLHNSRVEMAAINFRDAALFGRGRLLMSQATDQFAAADGHNNYFMVFESNVASRRVMFGAFGHYCRRSLPASSSVLNCSFVQEGMTFKGAMSQSYSS
jgi:hypothetical protein